MPKVEALRRWCAEDRARPDGHRVGRWASSPRTWTGSCARTPTATSSSGFTQFTLGFNGPDWTVDRAGDWLAWRDERNQPQTGAGLARTTNARRSPLTGRRRLATM